MPRRIQLSRRKGWRKPEGSIVVGRPSKWGNPFLLADVGRSHPSLTLEQCLGIAVAQFRHLIGSAELRQRFGYPSDTQIRAELTGRDLACWCPLEDDEGNPVPCHADVLLERANAPLEGPGTGLDEA